MVKLRDIWQTMYPYGTFHVGTGVYLTFDDGPIPEVTPQVLAILARYNVKATFFMVGENIDKHPDVFRQVIEAGHSIGNHTYNHLKGWRTPYNEYMENGKRHSTVSRQPSAISRCSGRLMAKRLSVSVMLCISRATVSSIGTSSPVTMKLRGHRNRCWRRSSVTPARVRSSISTTRSNPTSACWLSFRKPSSGFNSRVTPSCLCDFYAIKFAYMKNFV